MKTFILFCKMLHVKENTHEYNYTKIYPKLNALTH